MKPQQIGYLAGLHERDQAMLVGQQIAEILKGAGIEEICFLQKEEGVLSFTQNWPFPDNRNVMTVQYIVEPDPARDRIRILQKLCSLSNKTAGRTLMWYVEKRNRERENSEYMLFADQSSCGMYMVIEGFSQRRKAIVTSLLRMNIAATEEYAVLHALAEGTVSVTLMKELRAEYEDICSETQKEWNRYLRS